MAYYGQYEVPPPAKFVKLNVGQPSPSLLSLNLLETALQGVNNIDDPSLLQYGDIPGYRHFREDFANFLEKQYSVDVNPDNLFVTNGVTGALSFFCSLFTEKGSTVFVEEPTYFLALNIFKNDFKLNVKSVPMQQDGLDLDLLEEQLKNDDPSKLRFLYTIPVFHNPTSYTLSDAKRKRLAEMTEKYPNFIVLADEVYQMLYFDDSAKPPLPMCYYTDNAVSIGSFSKILAPALRMGWIHTKNKMVMDTMLNSGQMDSSGGNSPISQALIHELLKANKLESNINFLRQKLSSRCKKLSSIVREKLSKWVEFIEPTGGYFLWLKLKNNLSSEYTSMFDKYKVSFLSGKRFSVIGELDDYIRLSFSYYTNEGFEIGVDRLVQMFSNTHKRVFVNGSKGRLGSRIVYHLNNNNDFEKTDNLDNAHIIIDVTSPQGTKELLTYLIDNNKSIPLIIGTTGDLPVELINKYSLNTHVEVSSNFSNSVRYMFDVLSKTPSFLKDYNVSINETHHVHKKDSTSGTALSMGKSLQSSLGDINIKYISHREGEVIGEHDVVFENDFETITFSHKAKDRDLFAVGALNMCKEILDTSNTSKKLFKYEACGNDFVITEKSISLPEISNLCNRKTGIGADGLITVKLSGKIAYWTYYNADGSEVDMCGNGSRCVTKFLYDIGKNVNKLINTTSNIEQYVKVNKDTVDVTLPTDNFIFSATLVNYKDSFSENFSTCTAGVKHLFKKIPANMDKEFNQYYSSGKFMHISKQYDTNVSFYHMLNSHEMNIRTFERGVYDETDACGTACCAIAYNLACQSLTYAVDKKPITYKFNFTNGTSQRVTVDRANKCVHLIGPANKVFETTY